MNIFWNSCLQVVSQTQDMLEESYQLFLHMLNCITCLFLSWCHFAFGSWQCCCHDKGIPKYWKEWSDFAPGDCQLYASCMWSCLCYLSKRILDVQCSYVLTYCITALIILKFWPLNPVGHSCIYIQSSFAWEFITVTNQPYLFQLHSIMNKLNVCSKRWYFSYKHLPK